MEKIPVSRPSIGKEELTAIDSVFKTGWLGMGEKVMKFEEDLCRYLQSSHVICTNSCTAALHVALSTLNLKKNEEVIVPSFTYIATIQAIRAAGGTPVFCDIRSDDLNMDPEDAECKVTNKTRAILPVHYRGFPCDLDEIQRIANNNNLLVVEDAAHAFGSSYKGKKIGSFNHLTCFSFDPIKNITCGTGGAIAFQDDSLIDLISQRRYLGIDKDPWTRHQNEEGWFYDVVGDGYRYHMSDINAAIGLVQLSRFNSMNERKREVAMRYDEAFGEISGIQLLRNNDYQDIGLFLYTLLIKKNRNKLIDHLHRQGIGSSIHHIPVHQFSLYRTNTWHLPVTERIYNQVLSLPLFADITNEQVERVIRVVKEALQ
ncbi:MAG: DegT/DnrJ/EryC1/StrS aminotransferase family protein [Methanoregulaceae archaeon]|jgi:perosamine synthetase|nr:DegT/DnrJ/EryC1/StrS aminotransferase family protein [Methanoregulaceae archaeon]